MPASRHFSWRVFKILVLSHYLLQMSLCSKTFLGCLIGSFINMYILTMLGQYKSLVSPMKRGMILFSSHRKGLCLYLTPGSIFLFLPLSLQQPNDREDQNPYKILLSGWTFKLRYTFDSEHLLIFYKVSGSKNQPLYTKSLQRSPAVGDLYGTGIEIWPGFGPIGSTEKIGLGRL